MTDGIKVYLEESVFLVRFSVGSHADFLAICTCVFALPYVHLFGSGLWFRD